MHYRVRRALNRALAPLRVRVLIFEHTRIRVRSFPPLFEHERCESIHDRVARGGVVDCRLERGTYFLYETLQVPPFTTVKNGSFDLSSLSNGPFIKVIEGSTECSTSSSS